MSRPSRRTRRSAAASLALACCAAACGAPRPPNLLLISVDTLRADRLACYGGERDVGAALCELADPGIRYTWAFSPAPSTAPAIASLLTSRYPAQHGVTQFAVTSLADAADTVAEALAGAGYTTAAFVCNPVLGRLRNLGQGFEIYDDTMTRSERNRRIREREAAAVTEAALAWAGVVREPWFLWIHYQDPHGPYEPPGAATIRDAPGAPTLPLLDDHSGRGGIPKYQQLPGVASRAAYEQRYRAEIAYLDIQIDRLLRALSADAAGGELGVLLTADHGEAFGEDDYWFAHGHSLELAQIRVPLLWRPPGAATATAVPTPVSTLDVAPTLLAAAGVPAPATFEGRPLPRDARGAAAAAPRAIFAEHRARIAVIEGWRYYARDRAFLDRPIPDRITGGLLHPLPARDAELAPDGTASPYRSGESASASDLEARVADFLAAGGAPPAEDAGELAPEQREALRALGYLE